MSPAVPASLAGWVESWMGYREWTDGTVARVERPTGRSVLILELGPPILVGRAHDALQSYRGGFFAGIDDAPSLTVFRRVQEGIELNLTPLGAFALTRGGVGAFCRQVVEARELGLRADLYERLSESCSWTERFRILTEELQRALRKAWALSGTSQEALRILDATHGRIRLSNLAQRLGVSRKHLHQRFVTDVGLAPKQYASLRRFQRATDLLREGTSSLVDVALSAGYSDQAHLSREVRRLGGCTVTELQSSVRTQLEKELFELLP